MSDTTYNIQAPSSDITIVLDRGPQFTSVTAHEIEFGEPTLIDPFAESGPLRMAGYCDAEIVTHVLERYFRFEWFAAEFEASAIGLTCECED